MPEQEKTFVRRMLDGAMGRLGYVTVTKDKKAVALQPQSSLYSTLSGALDMKLGLPKPSRISFNTLRQIARYDAVTRICINTIKKQVSQAEWAVVPRKGVDADPAHIKAVQELFYKLNNNGENLRVLLDRVIEDILVLDAGVIEKVYNAKGDIVELNAVDGATIRPRYNAYGELDGSKSYIQVIDGKSVAEFDRQEIIYMMANPQNDVKMYGYGLSPIESIIVAVQASLNAEMFNASSFSQDNIPPGILDLGDMNEEEAKAFIQFWDASVTSNPQKMKFIWGATTQKKFTPLKNSNKDMQFVEYLDWLTRLKMATFGLTSLDANITQDVNRATATAQMEISKSRGVLQMKRLVEEYFDREIIMAMGFNDVVWRFEDATSVEEKKAQAEVDKIYIDSGVIMPSDVAKREGFISPEQIAEEDGQGGAYFEDPNAGDGPQNITDQLDTSNGNAPQKSRKGKHFKPVYEE